VNSKLFYKVMAGFYDLIDVIYFRNYKRSPRKIVLDAINDTDRVLDLCTGTATNAMRIAKTKPASKVIGIDLSKDMLRVAKSKAKKADVQNIRLYHMDATKMKFRDCCFDKILISLVLHEVEEELAGRILEEAKRVLKDDGEIIVTEWEKSEKTLQKILFFPISILEPKPFKAFIKKDLHQCFEKLGFAVVLEYHCDYSKVLVLKKMRE